MSARSPEATPLQLCRTSLPPFLGMFSSSSTTSKFPFRIGKYVIACSPSSATTISNVTPFSRSASSIRYTSAGLSSASRIRIFCDIDDTGRSEVQAYCTTHLLLRKGQVPAGVRGIRRDRQGRTEVLLRLRQIPGARQNCSDSRVRACFPFGRKLQLESLFKYRQGFLSCLDATSMEAREKYASP